MQRNGSDPATPSRKAAGGTGLGGRLVDASEALAAARGIGDLYLLTETAIDWSPRLGYHRDVRESAPAELRASPEFTGACPDSAVLLRKRLAVVLS